MQVYAHRKCRYAMVVDGFAFQNYVCFVAFRILFNAGRPKCSIDRTHLIAGFAIKGRSSKPTISNDLSLVRYLADRVVVMYLGNIVEQGTTDEVFAPPYHPYTQALLSAVPIADTSIEKKRIILEGALPSVVNPPKGCPFNTRCPRKIGRVCETEVPPVIAAE